jgi:hypothetical protein
MLREVLVQLPRMLPVVLLKQLLLLLAQVLSKQIALDATLLMQLKVATLRAAVMQSAGGMLLRRSTTSRPEAWC